MEGTVGSLHRPVQENFRPRAFTRITHDPAVMGGQPCIRRLRNGTVCRTDTEVRRIHP